MIKDKLIDSIFYNNIKNSLAKSNTSPDRNISFLDSSYTIDQIMNLDPNKIGYKEIISASQYSNNAESVNALFSALNKISTSFTSDYSKITKEYQQVYEKMKNALSNYRKRVDVLLDRSCLTIDNSYKNEILESRCGHFGNYLTLPYFINTSATYSGNAVFSIISDGQIQYSNFSNITSLPLESKPAFKLSSKNDQITTRIKVIVGNDSYNAIYLNIPSDKIFESSISIQTENGVVSADFDSGEIFFTFIKCKFSAVEITIKSNNYNPGKPYSMAISDFILIKNIEFMPYGVFKSKAVSMEEIKNIDSLTMTSKDANQNPQTNVIQSLSISNDSNILSYNRVDPDKYLDMSSYYLNKSQDLYLSDSYDLLTLNFGDNANGYQFYKIPFHSTDEMWDMQYTKANILVGINSDFMDGSQSERYRNWIKVDNYYTTYLANLSDPITINIGSKTFTLNEKEVTGNVTVPSGISKIKVMEKDINLEPHIEIHSEITGDELYLNNFMYLFTGLPEYNGQVPVLKEQTFNVKNQSVLYTQEPFVASGLIVTDNNGRQYRMHVSKNVTAEGTYTIEPNKGIVKVFPYAGTKSVTVKYYKSSILAPPVGILFADLLTFAPLASLLDATLGQSIFSIDGKSDEKVIYIPRESSLPAHAQILYNKTNEPIYLSTMIEMQTTNKYISPAIRSLTLSIK